MRKFYKNAKVVLENEIIDSGVLVEDGIIIAITKDAVADTVIDVEGNYLSPGFIDTHIHGAGGFDVMDATNEAVEKISDIIAEYGCTSYLPTTLTNSKERIISAVKNVKEVEKTQKSGAKILGVHLEGPCFSMKFKGAQNPKFLQNPSKELFKELDAGTGLVKRVSIAPELDGALQTAEYLADNRINVSIAHSDADFDTTIEATKHGFSHITHMFNGMSFISSPDYYCKLGVVEAGLYDDGLTAEIIADGKHQPVGAMKLLYKLKGADKMLLTTDSTRPTCMPEGDYELGGLSVMVTDGVAMLSDRTSFAGSVSTCDILVRYAVKQCGIPLVDAIKMTSLNHAKLIFMDDKLGSIAVGKVADLIVLDHDLKVIRVDISR